MSGRRVRIGVTAGDPGGIGPEVLAKALPPIELETEREVEFVRIGYTEPLHCGQATLEGARLALEALEEAAYRLRLGELDGVVTGPVCKQTLRQVGFAFPGQTEFFAAQAGVAEVSMLFHAREIAVGLVTIHEPLRRVPELLTVAAVERAGKHLAEFLHCTLGRHPRIAVAGLNPHAGEGGDFGDEEQSQIVPALERLRAQTEAEWAGPFAGDSLFPQILAGQFDGMLAMYHDQGLAPLKAMFFEEAVNVTWGLPFVRCSPDHGTGFAIAGKGVASPKSMKFALRLAVRLVRLKKAK